MDRNRIESILEEVKDGSLTVDDAMRSLRSLPYEDIGFAKIDTHRGLRRGFPEVIFCRGKTVEQVAAIVESVSENNEFIMATKADKEMYRAIKTVRGDAVYHEGAKIVTAGGSKGKALDSSKRIVIVSAGTSDLPYAEEAAVTAEVMGNVVDRIYDIGVAGIHRLFEHSEKLSSANVVIVVAGMEGALASVVGGLVDCPVIAVPTSVGYGANFEGLSALLAMLNCCSPGVTVVNIDNGFGAGYAAGMINQMGGRA